jgi:acetyl-CoA C-acetyltransferase
MPASRVDLSGHSIQPNTTVSPSFACTALFSNTEFHAIDAARLVSRPGKSVARLRDGEYDIGGRIPVNPSSDTLCTNAIAVTAMARVAETALQVWGRARAHQVKGARIGIASGNGGDHQIFGTMVIEA